MADDVQILFQESCMRLKDIASIADIAHESIGHVLEFSFVVTLPACSRRLVQLDCPSKIHDFNLASLTLVVEACSSRQHAADESTTRLIDKAATFHACEAALTTHAHHNVSPRQINIPARHKQRRFACTPTRAPRGSNSCLRRTSRCPHILLTSI